MNDELIEAAVALADMLARENRALAALDLKQVVALLGEKHRAADAFTAAQARMAVGSRLAAGQRGMAEQTAARLRDLADRNKRLLENAIAVQSRVIGLLTQFAPRALSRAPRYNAGGALAQTRSMPPLTFSARV